MTTFPEGVDPTAPIWKQMRWEFYVLPPGSDVGRVRPFRAEHPRGPDEDPDDEAS